MQEIDPRNQSNCPARPGSSASTSRAPGIWTLPSRLILFGALGGLSGLVGCAGGSTPAAPTPDFTLQTGPSTVTVIRNGDSQTVTVEASAVNSFSSSVTATLSGLPSGVTATPATLSLSPGIFGQFSLSASAGAIPGNATITVNGVSGSDTHTASFTLAVTSPSTPITTASISSPSYDFGNNLVGNSVTQSVVTVTNTGGQALAMSPAIAGDASYSLGSGGTCTASLAVSSSCTVFVTYDPTTSSAPNAQNAILNLNFSDVPSGTPDAVAITGMSGSISAGTVAATNNKQVALYTMTLPFPGAMTVNFGTTTSYGTSTWSQSVDAAGPISIFVAGMKPNTTYHMAATVTLGNGVTKTDTDHTFSSGALPNGILNNIATTTTPGMTPQPGVEVLNSVDSGTSLSSLTVTDLSGNILWTYSDPGDVASNFIQGVKQLTNGDFLMAIGANSANPIGAGVSTDTIQEILEVNLGGDTVKEISIADLNSLLASSSCNECNVKLLTLHHEVTPLPNGHWLVLGNTTMSLSSSTTPVLTGAATPVTVLGDVVVDLDQNLQPVWAWNEFNHLDVNRQPMQFPDWTHTNAILYSPDDGQLLISVRHQNWVLKVNYANGTGDGHILWHLGEGGDFTLKNGTDPIDWNYAQHGPGYFSSNTSGVFSLGLMDNGDDRQFPSGVTCGVGNAPPCLYTSIPVFQIDETAKTATLTFHQILPTSLYSFFGGNTEELANGNVEYDLAGPAGGSQIFEVTKTSTPQTVWNLLVPNNQLIYRGFRIPSLYPGVQW